MKKNTKIVVQMVVNLSNRTAFLQAALCYISYGATEDRAEHEAVLQDRRAHTQ